jgi:uncharacterized protein CbrC (UPF0167 family)
MKFRNWVQHQWHDHCNEFEAWFRRLPDYDIKDYFNRYKYWLKREYRHQQKMK